MSSPSGSGETPAGSREKGGPDEVRAGNACPLQAQPRVLFYGYGNPGRQDDGLGVALADELDAWAHSGGRTWLEFDRNYQLNAEDALAAARHDIVIFADASRDQEEPFLFREIFAAGAVSFSTHAMSPESVLALCSELYGALPPAFLLTVRGYEWDPNGPMTAAALANLDAAREFLVPFLDNPRRLFAR